MNISFQEDPYGRGYNLGTLSKIFKGLKPNIIVIVYIREHQCQAMQVDQQCDI